MTTTDPVFDVFVAHLQQLLVSVDEEPDEMLLKKVELELRGSNDATLLSKLGMPVLAIIQSDNTTAEAKEYAINTLDILLSVNKYEAIVNLFGVDLLKFGLLSGRTTLQKVCARLIMKISNPDNTATLPADLILSLFTVLSSPASSIGASMAIEESIVELCRKSDRMRLMIIDGDIYDILKRMRLDEVLEPRLSDLCLNLLPIIPRLPSNLYLFSEREVFDLEDLGLLKSVLFSYARILKEQEENGGLDFLETTMYDQFVQCAKLISDPELSSRMSAEFISSHAITLAQLSRTFPSTFKKIDKDYHIVDKCLEKPKSFISMEFLEAVDPLMLIDKEPIILDLRRDGVVELMRSLASCELYFNDRMGEDVLPASKLVSIEGSILIRFIYGLHKLEWIQKRLVNEWKPILQRIANPDDSLASPLLLDQRRDVLNTILNSGLDLGDLGPVLERGMEQLGRGVPPVEISTAHM